MYSLAEVMRRGLPLEPTAALKTTPRQRDTSFSEQLSETVTASPGQSGQRQDSVASRQVRAAVATPAATAADALGLIATPGAKATISGQTFYGSESGWSLTDTAPSAGASPDAVTGEQLLGFTPEWVPVVTAVMVNEGGQPSGTVQFNSKLYATEATTQKLANVLGATPVSAADAHPGTGASATQWELDFGDGKRLNAGLVADMFMRDPERAMARMRAELV